MRKIRRVSFWNLWLLLFVGGVLGGTIWSNLLGRDLLEQIGYFDGIFQTGMKMNHEEQWQLCRYVLSQRVGEVCFGGMLAMTPLAIPGYLILSFGTGFGMAVVITVFTLEKGWLGIWYWIMSVIPHGLCYLAIWLLLSAAVKEKQDLKRVRFWLLVGILVTIGGFLEAWANPWLLEFLYSLNIF